MSKLNLEFSAVGASDIGQRQYNEDAYFIDPERKLAIVADGVGGHEAGEVASAITCEVIAREIAAGATLNQAVRTANQEVMAAVQLGRGKTGMASTVVVVHCAGLDYQIAWVGDSRVYLWDGQLKLLTRDHSYVQALLAQGKITLEEARNHPRKNVIVQAIGLQSNEQIQVDENSGALAPGQLLLLCSDGLSDVVDAAQISTILAGEDTLENRCQSLVEAAVSGGGRDNITVVLLAGQQLDSTMDLATPEIVWSYNPATGTYSGLPEQESTSPSVRRIMPKGAVTEVTQMLPRADIMELQEASTSSGSNNRRWVLWGVLLTVAVLGLVYSLGLGGLV